MTMRTLAIVLSLASLALIVAGLLLPPIGVIDGSVLTAVGELIGLKALTLAWHAVDKGLDAKVTHGDTTINLINDDDDEDKK